MKIFIKGEKMKFYFINYFEAHQKYPNSPSYIFKLDHYPSQHEINTHRPKKYQTVGYSITHQHIFCMNGNLIWGDKIPETPFIQFAVKK